jgi:hypothetical protein
MCQNLVKILNNNSPVKVFANVCLKINYMYKIMKIDKINLKQFFVMSEQTIFISKNFLG